MGGACREKACLMEADRRRGSKVATENLPRSQREGRNERSGGRGGSEEMAGPGQRGLQTRFHLLASFLRAETRLKLSHGATWENSLEVPQRLKYRVTI